MPTKNNLQMEKLKIVVKPAPRTQVFLTLSFSPAQGTKNRTPSSTPPGFWNEDLEIPRV